MPDSVLFLSLLSQDVHIKLTSCISICHFVHLFQGRGALSLAALDESRLKASALSERETF